MKLLKKFLSTIISVGMLFSVASLYVFAAIPTNLDECCERLDRICTAEQKKEYEIAIWMTQVTICVEFTTSFFMIP